MTTEAEAAMHAANRENIVRALEGISTRNTSLERVQQQVDVFPLSDAELELVRKHRAKAEARKLKARLGSRRIQDGYGV